MAQTVGRNINRNDTTVLSSAIALNSITSTKLLDAKTPGVQPVRTVVIVSNNSSKDIWLKLQAEAVDNDKKGIFIPKGGYWEMPVDNIYVGEISAIADSGTPDVYITEY